MNFKPLGQRVLIERVEEDTKTASGIIIPDNAKEKPLAGVVRALSDEVAKDGAIKLNDQVVFAKYSGTEVKIEGKEYLIIKTEELLGIMG
ncbi:MAG: co-chaperone GroES [Wolinella sp.]